DTNKIPKHLFQGYLNIYNNYFKAPWMPDRTEANPNELNQDDARYGFRCCHLKNIWTAPLPPETRSEERFSRNAETDLVCRLLLEKKNNRGDCEALEDLNFHDNDRRRQRHPIMNVERRACMSIANRLVPKLHRRTCAF